MAFVLYCTENAENVRAVVEFRGLILETMVWFEVLAGVIFAICNFCYFENRKVLRIQVALEPLLYNGS